VRGEAGRAGERSGVPAAASVSARTTIRFASSILKALSPEGLASAGAPKRCLVRVGTRERFLRRAGPPGLWRDAAESQPRVPDRLAFNLQRRGSGYDGECIGCALAKLQIARMRGEAGGIGGEAKGDDQVARFERAFPLRRVARQKVQILQGDLAWAGPAFDLHDGVEGDERHTEVRRMRRDAVLAPAEYCGEPILAMEGVAARARFTPIAGAGGIVEVAAARALHEVAADGRGIAKLSRGTGQKRFGDGRIGAGERRIVCEVGVAYECTDAHAAIGKPLDPIETRQPRDIDEPVGSDGAALHQVEQIGARGEIDGARLARSRDRFRNRRWSYIVEVFHAALLRFRVARVFCASSTASVMPW